MGTGPTQHYALQSKDRRLQEVEKSLGLALIPAGKLKLADYCSHWLDEIKMPTSALRHKTHANYVAAIHVWVRPFLKEVTIVDLTRKDVIYLLSLIAQKGFSRSTQVQVRTVLKQVCDYAIEIGIRSDNPATGAKMQKKVKQLPPHFTKEEVLSIFKIAARFGTTAKWEIALIYGLRQGERLGLRWKDLTLDTAEPYMTVENQIQRQTGKGLVLLPVKTSHSARQIPLLDSTVEALRTHFQAEKIRAASASRELAETDYVFTSAVGGPIDCANDRKEWQALLKAANVPYRKGHAARHTAATLIGDLNQASKLLGHSSIQVTADFYAAVPQAAMRKALQGMKDEVENVSKD